MNDDGFDPAVLAATDQLGKMAQLMAIEFAGFYRTLIASGVPAALAKQMTLAHQSFRYGWTDSE